ncbi:MAG: CapA family protein, partial [Bacteroidaceae bacterium]|nr:CapA family protein [Bacteroidaceae bacterium]
MKKLSYFILASLLIVSCNNASAVKNIIAVTEDSVEVKPDTVTSTLLFVGDLMQHSGQFKAALACGGGKKYNYEETFRLVKPMISAATIAIGNFETTLGGEPYSGYPCFSAPDDYLYALKETGFDVLTTANNHCCDRRAKGLVRTLDVLQKADIPCCGTYADSLDRSKRYPLIFDAGGIKVCLLTYTYGTNGIPVQQPTIVNIIDKDQMAKDIKKAKSMKPDVIIASLHWGIENVTTENAEQRELAKWLIE